jgi:hypothetical protein
MAQDYKSENQKNKEKKGKMMKNKKELGYLHSPL